MSLRDNVFPRRSLGQLLGAPLLLAASATLVFAQALDTPTLTAKRAGFFRIDFDVRRGRAARRTGS